MDELRNKVNDDRADNPMRPYKIQFPYQVKFNLADDDNHTEVTISTISEEMTFARTKDDALFLKEKNDAYSKEGYAKHIVNWVQERMCSAYFLETCELAFTGTADVREMTDEEIDEYQREVISVAE